MLVLTRKVGEAIVIPSLGVSVTVRSTSGRRTRLAVSAPQDISVDRAEVRSRDEPQPESHLVQRPGEGIRVLLADADASSVSRHEKHLSRLGFHVDHVSDGCACASRLREQAFHVLVLDAGLLWGRAEGILALMEEHFTIPAVPVLVSYAERDRRKLAELRRFGVCGFIEKRTTPQQLAAYIWRTIPFPAEDHRSEA